MKVQISLTGNVDAVDAAALDEVATSLGSERIDINVTKLRVPGVKDGGLTIGIALAGLALTGIGTLVSVLSYWKSSKPQYVVKINAGDTTYTVKSTDPKDILSLSNALQDESSLINVEICRASNE